MMSDVAGPRFVVFGDLDTATVHVFRDLVTFEAGDDDKRARYRPLAEGDHVALGLMALDRAWCGQRSPRAGVFGIACFDDDRLCRRCVTSWPHDSVLLFEHETP